MNPHKSLLMLLLALSSACLDIPEVQFVEPVEDAPDSGLPPAQAVDSGSWEPGTRDAGPSSDAGTPDSGSGDSGTTGTGAGDSGTGPWMPDGGDAHELSVTWVAPASTVFTNATVSIAVSVAGGIPETVELLVDGTHLETLSPPYEFQLDTRSLPERTYSLMVRALAGDKSTVSPVRMVVVDRTPPSVVSRTPAMGEQNVSVRQSIRAVFSEPVRAETVTPESVRLTRADATAVAATPSVALDGLTLDVLPQWTLEAPNVFSLALDASITDLAGNALEPSSEAWTWRAPAFLHPGEAVNADRPGSEVWSVVFRIDGEGRPVVVWNQRGTSCVVYAKRWAGGSWEWLGSAVGAGANAASCFDPPTMEIDGSGRVVVAWSDGSRIHVRRWVANGWESLGALTAHPEQPKAISPFLLRGEGGRLLIAWSETDGIAANIVVREWTDEGTWEPLGELSAISGPTNAGMPNLSIDGAGRTMLSWCERNLSGSTSGFVYRRNGQVWAPLGAGMGRLPGCSASFGPWLQTDAQGRPVVAWDDSIDVVFSRWGFDAWEDLGTYRAISGTGRSPRYEFDAQGRLVMAVKVLKGGVACTRVVRRAATSTWEILDESLDALPGQTPVLLHALQADAQGDPTLVWAEYSGESSWIYVASYNR